MVEQLFGSKTRVKLLQLFYGNPNRSFYVREITRKIDEQINSVRRELSNLLNVGIILSENNNNRVYYEVNQKFGYYEPLKSIFGSDQPTGKTKAKQVKAADEDDELKAVGKVDLVIYTGQFTRDESSGIDVLLVGNINKNALQKYITELELHEGKELRYTSMSTGDFAYRRQIKDRFITNLLQAKKQVVLDKNNLLAEPEEQKE